MEFFSQDRIGIRIVAALALLFAFVPEEVSSQNVQFSDSYIKENRGTQKFLLPETYELANIIIALTPYGINEKRRVYQESEYYTKMKNHFWQFRNHPAVAALNFVDDRDIQRYYLFRENSAHWRFEGSKLVRNGPYSYSWGDGSNNLFAENRSLVEDFAKQTGFRKFFSENKPYYDALTADFARQAPISSMISWLEANFGGGLRYDSYKVIFSPLINRSHSTNGGITPQYKETLMFVGAPHIFGEGELAKAEVARMIFTEIDHNFVNPISDKHKPKIDEALSVVGIWNDEAPNGSYASQYATFNEYMTWSVFTLWAKEQFDPDTYGRVARLNRADMISRGFPLFMQFDKELVRLYEQRKPNEPIAGLYPAMLEYSRQLQDNKVANCACRKGS